MDKSKSNAHLFNPNKAEARNAAKRHKLLKANHKRWLAEQDKMKKLQEEYINNKKG